MTINQKINYLLANGYIEQYNEELDKIFISPNKRIIFSITDIIYRWDSLTIF